MSSVRFLNEQNPFWDFIAGLDGSNANHPFSNAYNPESRQPRGPPPEYGWPGASDHHDGPPPHHEGPPPPHHSGPPPPEHEDPPSPPPPGPHDHPFGPGFPFGGRRGGPHHGGHHGHHGGPHGHERRGGWGGRGRGGWGGRGGRCGGERGSNPWAAGGNFDMSKLADFISQFVPEDVLSNIAPRDNTATTSKEAATTNNKDFTPPADIFDTPDAYVVHISLPGAKKEDVGVNWDADKSELNVAGVIYRPGNEEFLKTLALDERKVGVFDRKVKLGSKANPANVDADSISAKMEDGVLLVTIPKTEEFVDVKKVDIE
ncbi:hypothetical protein HO173_010742 [Letharia columbiana]|uniref:SHSP domain-containing protein n=1 Tax=Letharia columbiana TaxID=112416 RepID=A0A8H6FM70_9LECA|nr:uncharacterized protein HO173_010742 [Letharia columbiana]KAF6231042.1 hypothetical protein HO173_010742 [Letharia columbiana]